MAIDSGPCPRGNDTVTTSGGEFTTTVDVAGVAISWEAGGVIVVTDPGAVTVAMIVSVTGTCVFGAKVTVTVFSEFLVTVWTTVVGRSRALEGVAVAPETVAGPPSTATTEYEARFCRPCCLSWF